MNLLYVAFAVAGASFVAMLAALEIGRRIGLRRLAREGAERPAGAGAVEGAVFVTSLTMYVILDIELPRFGAIRVANSDQVLVDLRASMK